MAKFSCKAPLEPWQVLDCTFVNDNTSFIKIHKETAKPVGEEVTFHFDVNPSQGDNFEQWLTVLKDSSSTWGELTMVPTGITSIIEDPDMQDGYKLDHVQCSVWDVDPITLEFSNEDKLAENVSSADLGPWQVLDCTFVNDNTAFIKIHKHSGMFEGEFPYDLTPMGQPTQPDVTSNVCSSHASNKMDSAPPLPSADKDRSMATSTAA